jgi:hypothetical protein
MMSMSECSIFRIGVVVLACTAMVLLPSLPYAFEVDPLAWVVMGAMGAIGIGLLFRARVARVVAGLGFLAYAVAVPITLARTVIDGGLPPESSSLSLRGAMLLGIANAVATAALSVWLCVRALQVLRGRALRASLATARVVGATLAVVAANHLWIAVVGGTGLALSELGALSISVSTQGTQVLGFLGWPIWHLVLLASALAMLVAPRRIVERVATLLVLWLACLIPPAIVSAVQFNIGGIGTFFVIMVAIPVYLAWWLRDELRSSADSCSPPSGSRLFRRRAARLLRSSSGSSSADRAQHRTRS